MHYAFFRLSGRKHNNHINANPFEYCKLVFVFFVVCIVFFLSSCTAPQQVPANGAPVRSQGATGGAGETPVEENRPPAQNASLDDSMLKADVSLMKDELSNVTKKLEELYHRVSVIQFMIDNHERSLRDLETRLEAAVNQEDIHGTQNINVAEKPITTNTDKATPEKAFEESVPEKARPIEENIPSVESQSGGFEKTDTPIDDMNNGFIEIPAESAETDPGIRYTSPENLYDKALAEYRKGEFSNAIDLFKTFLNRFQDHELSDNALYWIGECLYSQKEYEASINTFKKVVESYPNGSKVPDSYLKIGYAYLGLNDMATGRIFLKRVIQNYPFHPAGAKAEAKIRQLNNDEQ